MLLQLLGKLVRIFKEVRTDEGDLIADNEWNFVLDVDEQLGTYW